MDSAVVAALAQVLDDCGNQRINSGTAKSKVAAILYRKSPTEVLQELDTYVSTRPGNEKGKVVLIVIMALLRLNLDSGPVLIQEIEREKYELAGHLYGGLAMLLNRRSSNFTFRFSLLNPEAKNIYAEIERWNDHFFWPHIELFQTIDLLRHLDSSRFEQLAFADPNGIILLSMVQGYLSALPSDALLKQLLASSNRFHPNFAFAFYAQPILLLCNKIQRKEAKRGDIKKLNGHIDRCLTALEPCSPGLQAELLTNYLLVNLWTIPDAFARQLIGAELQDEFARQITKPGKIRTIQELGAIANLIDRTPAYDGKKRRITKRPLADAVMSVLIQFIQERTGIYAGDNHWLKNAEAILHLLTVCQRKYLGRFLDSQDRALMVSPLDELVRFEIYLKDIRHHQIIQSLQTCLSQQGKAAY